MTVKEIYTALANRMVGAMMMDFMADVENLMNRAPDEHTRMKVERMLNDLR